jgi:serine phosphatase RsbU (regulator of sigma subunit)
MSQPWIDLAMAVRPLPGEALSGDLHLVKPVADGVLMAVLDGVGHGKEALAAAETAVAILDNHAEAPLTSLVKRCHEALTTTRGVVMTLALLDPLAGTLAWLGVGSVDACLFRAEAKAGRAIERVMLRGGLVGYALPDLRLNIIPIAPGDLLVFATDGIRSSFTEGWVRRDPPQRIADRIIERHFKQTDDALVLVARYLGIRRLTD